MGFYGQKYSFDWIVEIVITWKDMRSTLDKKRIWSSLESSDNIPKTCADFYFYYFYLWTETQLDGSYRRKVKALFTDARRIMDRN